MRRWRIWWILFQSMPNRYMNRHISKRIIISWWRPIKNGMCAENYCRFNRSWKKTARSRRVPFVYWNRFRTRLYRVDIHIAVDALRNRIRRVLFAVDRYENGWNCILRELLLLSIIRFEPGNHSDATRRFVTPRVVPHLARWLHIPVETGFPPQNTIIHTECFAQ